MMGHQARPVGEFPATVASPSIGWYLALASTTPPLAHANAGSIPDMSLSGGLTTLSGALVCATGSEVVTWTFTWVPTVADPSPTCTPNVGGLGFEVSELPAFLVAFSRLGVLTVRATVNGILSDQIMLVITNAGNGYAAIAWGPV